MCSVRVKVVNVIITKQNQLFPSVIRHRHFLFLTVRLEELYIPEENQNRKRAPMKLTL